MFCSYLFIALNQCILQIVIYQIVIYELWSLRMSPISHISSIRIKRLASVVLSTVSVYIHLTQGDAKQRSPHGEVTPRGSSLPSYIVGPDPARPGGAPKTALPKRPGDPWTSDPRVYVPWHGGGGTDSHGTRPGRDPGGWGSQRKRRRKEIMKMLYSTHIVQTPIIKAPRKIALDPLVYLQIINIYKLPVNSSSE